MKEETKTEIGRLFCSDDEKLVRYIAYRIGEVDHTVSVRIDQVDQWFGDTDEPCMDSIEEVASFYVKWDGCSDISLDVHGCRLRDVVDSINMIKWAYNLAVEQLQTADLDQSHWKIEAIPND